MAWVDFIGGGARLNIISLYYVVANQEELAYGYICIYTDTNK